MQIDGEVHSLNELRRRLKATAEEDPSTMVVVRADKELAHGRVIEVMDLVRELGLTQFAIATEAGGAASK